MSEQPKLQPVTQRQPVPRIAKVLLYVLGGLTLAFGIVIMANGSPSRADDYTDWVTAVSYAVLWSAIISWLIVFLVSKQRRKDDFKPWRPTGGKPVDGWTPPAGWKSDPYEGRED
jgi:hypothetical protein